MASVAVQVEFAKRMIDLLQKEAPRKYDGVLCAPYDRWITRLAGEIKQLEYWYKAQGKRA